jgi:hypothetical protein
MSESEYRYDYIECTIICPELNPCFLFPLSSMVSFMKRIIDDVEAEWAPEACSGHRWHPSTRPFYITGIPTRSGLERRGILVPKRMAL